MWREARLNDKKIKSLMSDHRKRAERRRDFYDKIRKDPVEFLQVHGRALKIHMDSSVSSAAESCMVPWREDHGNMIDRFDVRAHLDLIPTANGNAEQEVNDELIRVNYYRWKTLVRHDFQGNSDSKVLQQIVLEEGRDLNPLNSKKKEKKEPKAAIPFTYEGSQGTYCPEKLSSSDSESDDNESQDTDQKELDIDSMSISEILKLKSCAHKYLIPNDDFIKMLELDREEEEMLRVKEEIEKEKSKFSGRKSRRERKAIKEKRMLLIRASGSESTQKHFSPDVKKQQEESSSSSESDGDTKGKTEFITSFGGSSEDEAKKKVKHSNKTRNRDSSTRHRDRSCEGRREKHRHRRSRSREGHRSLKKSRSRSRERHGHRKSRRSRSRTPPRKSDRKRDPPSKSRDRSLSPLDEFGRKKQSLDKTQSCVVESIPLPPQPDVGLEPPPPIKRYYRHDLAKESDDSSSDGDKDERPKDKDER